MGLELARGYVSKLLLEVRFRIKSNCKNFDSLTVDLFCLENRSG